MVVGGDARTKRRRKPQEGRRNGVGNGDPPAEADWVRDGGGLDEGGQSRRRGDTLVVRIYPESPGYASPSPHAIKVRPKQLLEPRDSPTGDGFP